jgi:hypothetical protein
MPVVTRSKTWAAAQEQKSRDIWARYVPAELNAAPVKLDLENAKHFKDSQSSFAKLDLSKMPKKPISEGFVFPKSTEQKLAEALAEIEALKKNERAIMASFEKMAASATRYYQQSMKLKDENKLLKQHADESKAWLKEALAKVDNNKTLESENIELKKKNEGLESTVKYLESEVDSWKEQYGSAVETSKKLRERIANPFKSAISAPF